MTSTKPYLIRAIYEWAEDNSFTPQVLVNAEIEDVLVPREHVVDGKIVLNIGASAVQLHIMDNECIRFSARFSGIEQNIYLPVGSILAIFARENSQGMFFDDMDDTDPEPTAPKRIKADPTPLNTKAKTKRETSHLTLIK